MSSSADQALADLLKRYGATLYKKDSTFTGMTKRLICTKPIWALSAKDIKNATVEKAVPPVPAGQASPRKLPKALKKAAAAAAAREAATAGSAAVPSSASGADAAPAPAQADAGAGASCAPTAAVAAASAGSAAVPSSAAGTDAAPAPAQTDAPDADTPAAAGPTSDTTATPPPSDTPATTPATPQPQHFADDDPNSPYYIHSQYTTEDMLRALDGTMMNEFTATKWTHDLIIIPAAPATAAAAAELQKQIDQLVADSRLWDAFPWLLQLAMYSLVCLGAEHDNTYQVMYRIVDIATRCGAQPYSFAEWLLPRATKKWGLGHSKTRDLVMWSVEHVFEEPDPRR